MLVTKILSLCSFISSCVFISVHTFRDTYEHTHTERRETSYVAFPQYLYHTYTFSFPTAQKLPKLCFLFEALIISSLSFTAQNQTNTVILIFQMASQFDLGNVKHGLVYCLPLDFLQMSHWGGLEQTMVDSHSLLMAQQDQL